MHISIDRERDPDRSKLRVLLETHEAYERMSAARSLAVHLLAVVGVMVWLGASWPMLLPGQGKAFVLALWGALLCVGILAGMKEWIWYRRLERRLAEYQPTRREARG